MNDLSWTNVWAFLGLAAFAGAAAAQEKLPKAALDILQKAEAFEVYSLAGDAVKDEFHGYKVLGKTTVKDAKTREKVAAAIAKGVEDGNNNKFMGAARNPRI